MNKNLTRSSWANSESSLPKSKCQDRSSLPGTWVRKQVYYTDILGQCTECFNYPISGSDKTGNFEYTLVLCFSSEQCVEYEWVLRSSSSLQPVGFYPSPEGPRSYHRSAEEIVYTPIVNRELETGDQELIQSELYECRGSRLHCWKPQGNAVFHIVYDRRDDLTLTESLLAT